MHFESVTVSSHEHTCFSRLKRLAVFYKRFDFSPTFREEREKIQHFGFYPEETYSQSSISPSWGCAVGEQTHPWGCRRNVSAYSAPPCWTEHQASFRQPRLSLVHGKAKRELDIPVLCLPILCVSAYDMANNVKIYPQKEYWIK